MRLRLDVQLSDACELAHHLPLSAGLALTRLHCSSLGALTSLRATCFCQVQETLGRLGLPKTVSTAADGRSAPELLAEACVRLSVCVRAQVVNSDKSHATVIDTQLSVAKEQKSVRGQVRR